MARGIERRRLFRDDVDRTTFVARLDEVCLQGEAALYAWCLLPNHFHLLVRTGAAPLSTLMRRLLTGYAVGFNRRHRRAGHLLQNRFKSIVVEEEAYLVELVRYIHLNAVRAGLVTTGAALANYQWAGHGALLGGARLRAHDVDFVLSHFGRAKRSACEAYCQFVDDGAGQGRRPELTGGGLRRSLRGWAARATLRRGREQWASDERILGSTDFVLQTLRELPASPLPPAGGGEALAATLELVASRCGIDVAAIRSNSHRPPAVAARAIVCFIAVYRHGVTPSAVAVQLGISRRSVARALERAQQLPSLTPDVADLLQ